MSDRDHSTAIRLEVPPRLFILPGTALTVGIALGLTRASRQASLQFLAENAHHPPTTKQGWYFYNKTKNYKVLLAGLKGGAREGGRLGLTALGWVGIEEGLERIGAPCKTLGAAVGTAGMFTLLYRLPWATSRQVMILATVVGGGMDLLGLWQKRLMMRDNDAPNAGGIL